MKKYNNVHQYETCVSTGTQYLNPDPEILTVGQRAQRAHPEIMPAKALLVWAFGLGIIPQLSDKDKDQLTA